MPPPSDIDLIPRFEEGCAGRLFTLQTQPRGRPAKGGILYLHPYGEEMHKSRRMAAMQARRFAAGGWSVLQFDLYGCGDSEGDAGDARWATWREDALAMTNRLLQGTQGPVALWGLRLGASLAVETAQELEDIRALLLWQPVINGEQYLNHLLRLKLAGDLVKAGTSGASAQDLRKALATGESLEIAGHRLDPELAGDLAEFRLSAFAPKVPVQWMEMNMDGQAGLGPASQQLIRNWQAAGVSVSGQVLACPDFWQTPEIQECPALTDASLEAMAMLSL